MAKKAHDHAGNMAHWAILPATCGPYYPLHVFISWLWFCIVCGFCTI